MRMRYPILASCRVRSLEEPCANQPTTSQLVLARRHRIPHPRRGILASDVAVQMKVKIVFKFVGDTQEALKGQACTDLNPARGVGPRPIRSTCHELTGVEDVADIET